MLKELIKILHCSLGSPLFQKPVQGLSMGIEHLGRGGVDDSPSVCRPPDHENQVRRKKIIGDYSPGYVYGNVKTHKPGTKLRLFEATSTK